MSNVRVLKDSVGFCYIPNEGYYFDDMEGIESEFDGLEIKEFRPFPEYRYFTAAFWVDTEAQIAEARLATEEIVQRYTKKED